MLIIRELAWRAPHAVAPRWMGLPHVAWLDSAASSAQGRYSYICPRPYRVMDVHENTVRQDGRPVLGVDPWVFLRRQLQAGVLAAPDAPVPFIGGAVGILGYELGGTLENLPRRHPPLASPDLLMGFYDALIAFDHQAQRCWVLSSGVGARAPDQRAMRAAQQARLLEQEFLEAEVVSVPLRKAPPVLWRADMTREVYEQKIRRLLAYIQAGDIFQANFTARFLADRPAHLRLEDIYARLRAFSPTPFAAFIKGGADFALLSASPERFLSLDAQGGVEARPIKGTRPRSSDAAQDEAWREELMRSSKDRAENLMIVDLLRNDIGRVACAGSVEVPSLCGLESFASVHHLVSVVRGQLQPGLDALDLLRATFPGGSITGAPKIRAMQIIDELEQARRGPYCGALAWIGFDGRMDSSIVIRTLVATRHHLIAQAGGGIVWESDPSEEYEEMRTKIRPLLEAVGGMA